MAINYENFTLKLAYEIGKIVSEKNMNKNMKQLFLFPCHLSLKVNEIDTFIIESSCSGISFSFNLIMKKLFSI